MRYTGGCDHQNRDSAVSVHKIGQGTSQRWEVRWRAAGKQHKRRFPSKTAADRWDAKLRTGVESRGDRSRRLTVNELMATWLSTKTALRPKTLDAYRMDAKEVTDWFDGRLAASLKPSEIRVWSARARGVSLRRRSLTALRQAYKLALGDGLLSIDPTKEVPLPKVGHETMRFLSWDELSQLAAAAGAHAPLVWVLGTCGLRLGEALGLEGDDVDDQRRRLMVRRSYSVSSAGAEMGPTKGKKARDVPVMPFVLDMLPHRDGALFVGERGRRLNPATFRINVFQEAAARVGLGEVVRSKDGVVRAYVGMHPHELRHTAASLAIASGADVKAVQRMLGHKSAAMTLDLYGHLWDAQLDSVASRMQSAAGHSGIFGPGADAGDAA